MEKLTRKLINTLLNPRNLKEITLEVCNVPISFDRLNGNPKKYVPGINYKGIMSSGGDIAGKLFCDRRIFDSDEYTEARIVASEAKTYLESFGAKVTINHIK